MPDSTSDLTPSVFQRLNQTYCRLLSSETPLLNLLETISSSEYILSTLQQKLATKVKLLESLRHVIHLRSALNKHDKTKYLLDILRLNLDVALSYEQFQSILDETTRTRWEDQYRRLTTPTYKSQFNGLLSTATAIPVSFYHHFVPTFIQNTVKVFAPDTIDSESKRILLDCIDVTEDLLNQRIREINRDITTLLTDLVLFFNLDIETLPSIESELKGYTSDQIESLYQTTMAAKAIAETFEDLIADVHQNKTNLARINALDSQIDKFVAKYDGIIVAISNFLAKYIASFFKTTKAEQIDELKQIKSNLQNLRTEVETQNQQLLSNIDKNQYLAPIVKNAFKARLESETPIIATTSMSFSNRNGFFKEIQQENQTLETDLHTSASPVST
ncbi:hypothetical protein [Legionella impletisoli]|uniref:Uncharacterized protein n=1 Tax=Legionella impletisoli TaxID=343510 RepID=A0A917JR98_9GAMM|nr:hypothetical protein [Legionella impletisoli]GGI79774.1 hypothetical protein GCM10007966_05380 [Legionella impletisoli]